MQLRHGFIGVILGAAALLTGCGDRSAEEGTTPAATSTPTQKPAAPGAGDQVAAVTMSGDETPVTLRFALQSKPRINEPMELQFSLRPGRDIESAQVAFEPNDTIIITSANPFFSLGRTAAGESVAYTLTLVPKKSGILALTAIATLDLPTGPMARTFSIPIMVMVDAPAQAGAAPGKPAG
ncbi:MAG: hypothetical protein ABIT36_13285 [Steroidobacteraceae bacterium]